MGLIPRGGDTKRISLPPCTARLTQPSILPRSVNEYWIKPGLIWVINDQWLSTYDSGSVGRTPILTKLMETRFKGAYSLVANRPGGWKIFQILIGGGGLEIFPNINSQGGFSKTLN